MDVVSSCCFFASFFSEKVLYFCSSSNALFCCLTSDSFKVQCISNVKRKTNSYIEEQKCKVPEKLDRLLISKMAIIYPMFQRNKSLTR